MKKLMIAAAIVCAAAFANAASCNWEASNVKDHLGQTAFSGAVTIFASLEEEGNWFQVAETSMSGGSFDYGDTFGDLEGGEAYDFYYTMKDGDWTFTSGIETMTMHATQTKYIDFGSSGEWSSVPEPTSGLLLLLGVAGLALKRKRA